MKGIKYLAIVTSNGASTYMIGCEGVTLIKQESKQIAIDEYISVFRVYKGNDLYAEISLSCPYEIKLIYDL